MTVINANIAAMRAARSTSVADTMLSTSMERLSTGKRINSAKDDAAGLAIATSMTSSIKGMGQAIRNANDGISLAQTAEGALGEVTNMLQRIGELATQSASGTYDNTTDRAYMQKQVDGLTAQIGQVVTTSEFNGVKLFEGTGGNAGVVTIQTGASSGETLDLAMADLTGLAGGTGAAGSYDVLTATAANALVDSVKIELDTISNARATLGAGQSRLESVVNNLTSNATNLSAARSNIEDTDYSSESTALAKAQILGQASAAMLAQANQSQQSVMSLLKG